MIINTKHIFIGILLFLLALVTIISLPWLLMFGLSIIEPSPPVPEIIYGEFPFRLEYSIDGEIFVVEDVVICEYAGVKWNEGKGKYRVWKKRLKRYGEENLLIVEDGKQKIFCNVGSAEYYMGDQQYQPETSLVPTVYPSIGGEFHTQQEIMDKYKIKLIKWEFSPPIENKFE